jgi:hypothetical protein
MTGSLQAVDEFDTRGELYGWRIIRVVFDPVGLNYHVGYDSAHASDNGFEHWTQVDWGRPHSAKQAHRRVLSYDTHLRCFKDKIACALAIEMHTKDRGALVSTPLSELEIENEREAVKAWIGENQSVVNKWIQRGV